MSRGRHGDDDKTPVDGIRIGIGFRTVSGDLLEVGFCEKNLNLLAHAQAIELDIGSECGGHGICGKDRVRLTPETQALVSPLTEDERGHLSKDEIAQGWRLGCQCFPNRDGLNFEVWTR